MNINRYNYKRALPLVVQSMREADYIAFDFEFSGLQSDADLFSNHQSDSIELRYWKYKENITQFTPLQLGICSFKYDEQIRSLECQPFNFYIMPSAKKNFLSQTSSLNFLASHGFDFNKLIYESCRYQSIAEYAKSRQEKSSSQDTTQQMGDVAIKDPDCVIFCNSKFQLIDEWLNQARPLLETGDQHMLLDISYCRYKLFSSLQKNLGLMFPKDVLVTEIEVDNLNSEMFMKITLTKQQRQEQKKQCEKEMQKIHELQKYLLAKERSNYELCQVLRELLHDSEWEHEEVKFQQLTSNMQQLFHAPESIQFPRQKDLIAFLASKVSSLQQESDDQLGVTRIVDLMSLL